MSRPCRHEKSIREHARSDHETGLDQARPNVVGAASAGGETSEHERGRDGCGNAANGELANHFEVDGLLTQVLHRSDSSRDQREHERCGDRDGGMDPKDEDQERRQKGPATHPGEPDGNSNAQTKKNNEQIRQGKCASVS